MGVNKIEVCYILNLEGLEGNTLTSTFTAFHKQLYDTDPPTELLSCFDSERLRNDIRDLQVKLHDPDPSAKGVETRDTGRFLSQTFFCFDDKETFQCVTDELDKKQHKLVLPELFEIRLRDSNIAFYSAIE